MLKELDVWKPLSSRTSHLEEFVLMVREKMHYLILLSLLDEILREVTNEENASRLWLKLEKLL